MSGGIGGCVKQIGQDVPWLSAMCGYTLTPQHHEVLVIEDMLEDARYVLAGLQAGFTSDAVSCQGCRIIEARALRPDKCSSCV